MNLPNTFRSNH